MATDKNKILIVDDELNWQRELSLILAREKYLVIVAGTFEEAKDDLIKNGFELAIIDLSLDPDDPDNRQGRELMALIRKQNPSIPVIGISGFATAEESKSLINENLVESFFSKSEFDPEEFLEAVSKFIKS